MIQIHFRIFNTAQTVFITVNSIISLLLIIVVIFRYFVWHHHGGCSSTIGFHYRWKGGPRTGRWFQWICRGFVSSWMLLFLVVIIVQATTPTTMFFVDIFAIKIKHWCSTTTTYSSAIMFIIVHYIITIVLLITGIIDDHRAIVTDHDYRCHLESFLGRDCAIFLSSTLVLILWTGTTTTRLAVITVERKMR